MAQSKSVRSFNTSKTLDPEDVRYKEEKITSQFIEKGKREIEVSIYLRNDGQSNSFGEGLDPINYILEGSLEKIHEIDQCPNCGTTWNDISYGLCLGCEQCIGHFADLIESIKEPLIENPEVPQHLKQIDAIVLKKQEYQSLLESAVQEENYELAEILRKEILSIDELPKIESHEKKYRLEILGSDQTEVPRFSLSLNSKLANALTNYWRIYGSMDSHIISHKVTLFRSVSPYFFQDHISGKEEQELRFNLFSALNQAPEYLPPQELGFLDQEAKQYLWASLFPEQIMPVKFPLQLFIPKENYDPYVILGGLEHLSIVKKMPGALTTDTVLECKEKEQLIGSNLPYSFDFMFGYLNANVTNLGYATEFSVLLHLPSLYGSEFLTEWKEKSLKEGFHLRELDFSDSLFELRGKIQNNEDEALEKFAHYVESLVHYEQRLIESDLQKNRASQEDEAFRNLGLLRYMRRISLDEAWRRISCLKRLIPFFNQLDIEESRISMILAMLMVENKQRNFSNFPSSLIESGELLRQLSIIELGREAGLGQEEDEVRAALIRSCLG